MNYLRRAVGKSGFREKVFPLTKKNKLSRPKKSGFEDGPLLISFPGNKAFSLVKALSQNAICSVFLHFLKNMLTHFFADFARPWSRLLSFPLPPQGTFSALAEVRRGLRPGGIILRSQKMPRFQKSSMTVRSGFHQHLQQPWPVFWSHHQSAHLVSRSLALLDMGKGLMVESAYGRFFRHDSAWTALYAPPAVHLKGNWTSIVSHWCPISRTRNYYHWLFDAIPRLACLTHFPADVEILVPGVLPNFAEETLLLLGLKNRYRITQEQHLLIESYFYSGLVGMTGCHNPYAVRYLRRSFLQHTQTFGLPRYFFIGRKHSSRGIQNNDQVESFFKDQGWAVIYLEDLSFRQQLSLFAGAKAVCALHGAGLANLVWSRPGTFVLELFADNYLHGTFEGIAKINRLKYRSAVFRATNSRRPWVDLNILKRHLRQFSSCLGRDRFKPTQRGAR